MQRLEEKVVTPIVRSDWVDNVGRPLQHFLSALFHGSEAGRSAKDFLNGVWLAHPLHPAVTDIPIGAWTSAFALDCVESATGKDLSGATSTVIGVGIGGAVASALTGVADWSDTYGDQRRVGLIHALANVLALTLYAGSLLSRLNGRRSVGKTLSGAGLATVLAAAYLGGELAYRLGTQVDRNAYSRGPRDFTPTVNEADLPESKPTRVVVQDTPVMLVRRGNRVFALNDVCSHAGCSLSDGRLEDESIVCSCHGSTFRLSDGEVLHGPSPYSQPHHEVRTRGGKIEVRMAAPA